MCARVSSLSPAVFQEELQPAPIRRQRRFSPKSRNGCLTCKARRVKCDEGRPSCQRCLDTDRDCEGYGSSVDTKNLVKYDKVPHPVRKSPSTVVPESRAVDFFRLVTAPYLAGYFEEHIHSYMMLQLSQREPAVQHAIAAVAALHEVRIYPKTSTNVTQFGVPDSPESGKVAPYYLIQYGRALQRLRQLIEDKNASLDVVLICSLLLMHFELLRECPAAALCHLENALWVLHADFSSKQRKIDFKIAGAIIRLDLNATGHFGLRKAGLTFYGPDFEEELPTYVNDLQEATTLVNLWIGRMLHMKRSHADYYRCNEPGDIPLEIYARAQHYRRTFEGLEHLVNELIRQTPTEDAHEHRCLSLLLVRAMLSRIGATTFLLAEASATDAHIDDYKTIVDLCEDIIDSKGADRRLFSASFSESLPLPLFLIATSCRDGITRRRALANLERLPGERSTWHMEAMLGLARLVIDYEESGCDKDVITARDIPEWRRVLNTEFGAWSTTPFGRSVTVRLRTRPNGMDGDWYDDTREIIFKSSASQKLNSQLQISGTMFDFVAERRWAAMTANSLNSVKGGGILTRGAQIEKVKSERSAET